MLKVLFRFRRDRSGVSAVEFALTAPVLLFGLLGVVDLGNAVYQRTDMESALRAGVQYFMNGGDDLTRAEQVVSDAWSSKPPGVSIDATRYCQCGVTAHACNVLCDDDTYPVAYNRIEAAASFPGILMENAYESQQSVRVR